jgi:hypothetical protein
MATGPWVSGGTAVVDAPRRARGSRPHARARGGSAATGTATRFERGRIEGVRPRASHRAGLYKQATSPVNARANAEEIWVRIDLTYEARDVAPTQGRSRLERCLEARPDPHLQAGAATCRPTSSSPGDGTRQSSVRESAVTHSQHRIAASAPPAGATVAGARERTRPSGREQDDLPASDTRPGAVKRIHRSLPTRLCRG